MPGAALSHTVSLAAFAEALDTTADALSGLSYKTPLEACKLILVAAAQECFRQSHAPDGTPWEGLHFPRLNSKGGDLPLRDSGRLMASIVGWGQGHIEEIDDFTLTVGTNLDYAATHQYGAHIEPTQAKMLAIPLTPEAADCPKPREFPRPLFVLKTNGKLFLAETVEKSRGRGKNRAKKGEVVCHYILLASVDIPARPFLGINEETLKQIEAILIEWIVKHLHREGL